MVLTPLNPQMIMYRADYFEVVGRCIDLRQANSCFMVN